jgi:hypothetical protein
MLLWYKVTCNVLNIRSGAGTSYKKVGHFYKGNILVITNSKKVGSVTWYQGSVGWVSGQYLSFVKDAAAKPTTGSTKVPAKTVADSRNEYTRGLEQNVAAAQAVQKGGKLYSEDGTHAPKLFRTVYGAPFQFLPSADTRYPVGSSNGSHYGRMYFDAIVATMPIACIIPGKPKFLPGWKPEQSKGILKTLFNLDSTEGSDDKVQQRLADLMGQKNSRYFMFDEDYKTYMYYVNSLANMTSFYMGVNGKKPFDGAHGSFGTMDWSPNNLETDAGNMLDKLFGLDRAVTVFFDPTSSVTESSSNNTKQSALEGALSNASAASKELDFLLGAGLGLNVQKQNYANADEEISNFQKKWKMQEGSLMNTIIGKGGSALKTITSGASILFPEIWNDSSFSRNYSLEIKLISPYGDNLSVYQYVIVPLIHLMCLAFPRQFGPNGYSAPFIVQAFAKGVFNCEMGIIDNITIRRGGSDGSSRNSEGIPTEIDVTLSIKDLYPMVTIASDHLDSRASFINNTGLIDYLAGMCCINLNKPDLARKIDMMFTSKMAGLRQLPGNLNNAFHDYVRNKIMNSVRY